MDELRIPRQTDTADPDERVMSDDDLEQAEKQGQAEE